MTSNGFITMHLDILDVNEVLADKVSLRICCVNITRNYSYISLQNSNEVEVIKSDPGTQVWREWKRCGANDAVHEPFETNCFNMTRDGRITLDVKYMPLCRLPPGSEVVGVFIELWEARSHLIKYRTRVGWNFFRFDHSQDLSLKHRLKFRPYKFRAPFQSSVQFVDERTLFEFEKIKGRPLVAFEMDKLNSWGFRWHKSDVINCAIQLSVFETMEVPKFAIPDEDDLEGGVVTKHLEKSKEDQNTFFRKLKISENHWICSLPDKIYMNMILQPREISSNFFSCCKLAFCPTGIFLAVCTISRFQCEIFVIDLGKVMKEESAVDESHGIFLMDHPVGVQLVAVTDLFWIDEDNLVCCASDGIVKIWNVTEIKSGRKSEKILPHPNRVISGTSSDKLFMSVVDDHGIFVWHDVRKVSRISGKFTCARICSNVHSHSVSLLASNGFGKIDLFAISTTNFHVSHISSFSLPRTEGGSSIINFQCVSTQTHLHPMVLSRAMTAVILASCSDGGNRLILVPPVIEKENSGDYLCEIILAVREGIGDGNFIGRATISADGRYIVCAALLERGERSLVTVYDSISGEVVKEFPKFPCVFPISDCAWAPLSSILVIAPFCEDPGLTSSLLLLVPSKLASSSSANSSAVVHHVQFPQKLQSSGISSSSSVIAIEPSTPSPRHANWQTDWTEKEHALDRQLTRRLKSQIIEDLLGQTSVRRRRRANN